MMVFIAHPIDFVDVTNTSIDEYVNQAVEHLHYHGATVVYNPSLAFNAKKPMHKNIQQINQHALQCADALLALLPHDVRSIGVPFEIGYATALGKPLTVVSGQTRDESFDIQKHSAVLSSLESPLWSFDELRFACGSLCSKTRAHIERLETK